MIRFLCFIMVLEIISTLGQSNCPSSTKFEKIIGLPKAPLNNSQLLLRLKPAEPKRPITLDCLKLCQQDPQCQSFVLHYDTFECYWFLSDVTHSLSQRLRDEVDNDAAWFVKVCLVVPTCQKSWIFETIRGATLVGNNTKTLPNQTRTACQQSCLNEKDFECKSIKFRINLDYDSGNNNESFGQCILSKSDRHLMPNAYRVSTYDDYYLENQCDEDSSENIDSNGDFCAYEEYDNVTFAHGDLMVTGSKVSCQNQCDQLDSFNCRGYTLSANNCILHSEDTKLRGPRLLSLSQDTYFEKARCLNISVSCSDSFMAVRYQPENDFHGKLYMQGYSENPECFVVGRGESLIILKIPLLTSQCGIIQAGSPLNRTLMAGNLILQYNQLIQTQSDRILKVGCIFGNQSKILIGTGINITSSLPNKGSTLVNTASNETVAPKVEMRVVDLRTQEEATDTQIGQELQLIIELKEISNTIDFWASHLIAMTEKGEESLFLLDDRGCPTNLNIFPALQKITEPNEKKLVATFQAFKFAVSPVVRFSVMVMFCPEQCMPIQCDDGIQSFGRRKRAINAHILDTINGRAMLSKKEFPSTVVNQMPLEYVMIVRSSSSSPDRLILGNKDGEVLVAGYNYATNEVCMDYSLVIGLIVTWILVQLIFIITSVSLVRRYRKHYEQEYNRATLEDLHKNFGLGFSNLDNRRVRWADNGENIIL